MREQINAGIFNHGFDRFNKFIICAICGFILILGCSPERDNPLDPKSPYFKPIGNVEGRVLNYDSEPVDSALISTIPLKFSAYTDENGYWAMDPDSGNWRFVASHPSKYQPDTSGWFRIKPGEKKIIPTFVLNRNPYFTDQKITTHWEDESAQGRGYYALIHFKVNDDDGTSDIESVWACYDTIKIPTSLNGECVTEKLFKSTSPDKLNAFLEVQFKFKGIVRDKKGGEGISEPFQITRVMTDQIKLLSPGSYETVSPTPTLRWECDTTYHLTYTTMIVNPYVSPHDTLWITTTDAESVQVTDSLPLNPPGEPGEPYYWLVIGSDDYENTTIPYPISFWVDTLK